MPAPAPPPELPSEPAPLGGLIEQLEAQVRRLVEANVQLRADLKSNRTAPRVDDARFAELQRQNEELRSQLAMRSLSANEVGGHDGDLDHEMRMRLEGVLGKLDVLEELVQNAAASAK